MKGDDRMTEEVRAYLDGEVDFVSLSPGAQEEAGIWDRAAAALRPVQGAGAPEWLEDRIMAELDSGSDESSGTPATKRQSWLTRPVNVRVTPLAGLLAAAALAAVVLLPGGDGDSIAAPETVYVQFVLEAPGAHSVSVAGDFSEWEDEHTLADADGDGVWTGRVPLRPGVHQYMFVIDGADWVTDPQAERYADDGFGNRNAIIAVGSAQVSS